MSAAPRFPPLPDPPSLESFDLDRSEEEEDRADENAASSNQLRETRQLFQRIQQFLEKRGQFAFAKPITDGNNKKNPDLIQTREHRNGQVVITSFRFLSFEDITNLKEKHATCPTYEPDGAKVRVVWLFSFLLVDQLVFELIRTI